MSDKDEPSSKKRAHDAVSATTSMFATDTSPLTAEVKQYPVQGYPLPQLHQVRREHPDSTLFPIKDYWVWVLPDRIGIKKPMSKILVRQEYHDLLVAILHSIKARNDIDVHFSQNSKRMRDENSGPTIKREEEDIYLGDAWALPIIQDGTQILSNFTSSDSKYPNPFAGEGDSFRPNGGVVITGYPGIGKTTFLKYIFHLRAAAGLPTIYMPGGKITTVYKNGYMGKITDANEDIFLENMPDSTWALIDSNANLVTIPQDIIETGFFVVQAASPRKDRMQAALKLEDNGAQVCVMQPFTPWELVIAQSLRFEGRRGAGMFPASERQLVEFHERFGGSARHAAVEAQQQDEFDARINSITAKPDDLRSLLHNTTSAGLDGSIPDDIAHMLVSVFPLTDADRRQFRIGPPSRDIYLKLEERLKITQEGARREFFETCLQADTPGSKSLAGEMLDQHFHRLITGGGIWKLRRFDQGAQGNSKAVTRTYTVENSISNVVLKVHQTVEIVTSNTEAPSEFTSVPIQIWGDRVQDEPVGTTLGVGIYYHPKRRNFPGADSFYILEPGHALLFQASVKASPHGFTVEAVDWFEARGVTKFTYIYVSPPKYNPRVQLPRAHENKFKGRMYAVELSL